MDIHSCSYFCDRPECIKRQRDELRAQLLVQVDSLGPKLSVHEQPQQVQELALLVVRLARALAKASPESKFPKQATEFLERIGFMDAASKNILRET
jgi:uncharacterized membrane protein YcfT